MAEKMVFLTDDNNPYKEELINYTFVPGFAPIQRKKNVVNLFNSLKELYPNKKVLEISTKSENELGKKLSAFNLVLDGHYLESIYQSSKVFYGNVQYKELMDKKPIEAKRFISNIKHKEIISFRYNNKEYPIKPESFFYDYMYIKALYANKDISLELLDYDIFTDIEFNYKKSINCQARSCAIFVYLYKNNLIEAYLEDYKLFMTLYNNKNGDNKTLFDL